MCLIPPEVRFQTLVCPAKIVPNDVFNIHSPVLLISLDIKASGIYRKLYTLSEEKI